MNETSGGPLRRVRRFWHHPDPAIRVLFRIQLCAVLLVGLVLLLVQLAGLTSRWLVVMQAGLTVMAAAGCGTYVLRQLRRARRIMAAEGQPGGWFNAAVWAFRNGDFAVRLAYVTLLVLGWLLVRQLFGSGPAARLPDGGFYILLLWPLANLFQYGQIGRTRFLPGSAVPMRGVTIVGLVLIMFGAWIGIAFLMEEWWPDALEVLLLLLYTLFLIIVSVIWGHANSARQVALRRARKRTRETRARMAAN